MNPITMKGSMESMRGLTTFIGIVISLSLFGSQSIDQSTSQLHKECYAHFKKKEYKEAIKVATLALDNTGNTKEEVSESYYIIGYAQRKLNYFSESISYFEGAIDATDSDDKKGKILNNLGAVLSYVNLYNQAIKEYDKAIELSSKWGPVSHYNKAIAQIELFEYAEAQETIESGLVICEEQENEFYKSRLWNQNGIIETELFKASADTAHSKRARQYFYYSLQNEKNAVEVGKAFQYLAELNLVEGDTLSAIENLEQSIASQKNDQYRFRAINALAELHIQQNELAKAAPLIDTALVIFPSITLSGDFLMVFFNAQDIGYEVPEFRAHFQNFISEKDQTLKAYAAYIGRQIVKEREQERIEKNQRVLIMVLAVIGLIILSIAIRYFMRVLQARREVMSELKARQ